LHAKSYRDPHLCVKFLALLPDFLPAASPVLKIWPCRIPNSAPKFHSASARYDGHRSLHYIDLGVFALYMLGTWRSGSGLRQRQKHR